MVLNRYLSLAFIVGEPLAIQQGNPENNGINDKTICQLPDRQVFRWRSTFYKERKMENSASDALKSDLYGLAFILCFALVLMLCHGLFLYATTGTERITIKEIRFGQDQAVTKYMIYTRDGQVLKNANTIFFMKFKSDELFMKLKAGKTYEVKTCGLRVPFLGWYKNIITAREIKPAEKKKPVRASRKK